MGTIARFFNIPQASSNFWLNLNKQIMTNPTVVSPVKMVYGWNFSISGLKMMVKSGLEKIFLKFLQAITISFLLHTEFVLLNKTPPFYEVNSFNRKWRNFKNIFSRPLFTIIFRPEMLKFHPHSILTRDTMVEFVIFCVLKKDWNEIVILEYSQQVWVVKLPP